MYVDKDNENIRNTVATFLELSKVKNLTIDEYETLLKYVEPYVKSQYSENQFKLIKQGALNEINMLKEMQKKLKDTDKPIVTYGNAFDAISEKRFDVEYITAKIKIGCFAGAMSAAISIGYPELDNMSKRIKRELMANMSDGN